MGHFGIAKTLDALHEHFFWPNMKSDVSEYCANGITCLQAKSKVHRMACIHHCMFHNHLG